MLYNGVTNYKEYFSNVHNYRGYRIDRGRLGLHV